MRTSIHVATSLTALLVGAAAAQETPPAAPMTGAASNIGFIAAQEEGETLASSLIGSPVLNSENQSLGDINDAILDADGRLKAVVVGVGGFLGIGERDVAVPWQAVDVDHEDDGDLALSLAVSREQLEGAPAFESLEDRRMAEEAARAPQPAPTGAVPPAPVPGGAPAPAQ
jgi:hypothetical protein